MLNQEAHKNIYSDLSLSTYRPSATKDYTLPKPNLRSLSQYANGLLAIFLVYVFLCGATDQPMRKDKHSFRKGCAAGKKNALDNKKTQ